MSQVKFSAARSELLEAIQTAALASAKRSPRPALTGVEIKASAGRVVITGTDSEIRTECQRQVSTSGDYDFGSIVVSPAILAALVKTGPETIDCELTEDQLTVSGVGSVPAHAKADQFPAVLNSCESKQRAVISIDAELLRTALSAVVPACDVDSTRYALGGVLLDITRPASGLTLVATDSCRLVTYEIPSALVMLPNEQAQNPDTIIPASHCKALIKALKAVRGSVVIDLFDNRWQVSMPEQRAEFRGLYVQGRFPRYQEVIPAVRYFPYLVDNSKALKIHLDAIKRVLSKEHRGAEIQFMGAEFRMNYKAPDGHTYSGSVPASGSETMPIDPTMIDPRYLLDVISSVPAGATLEFSQEQRTFQEIQNKATHSGFPLKITCGPVTWVIMPLGK